MLPLLSTFGDLSVLVSFPSTINWLIDGMNFSCSRQHSWYSSCRGSSRASSYFRCIPCFRWRLKRNRTSITSSRLALTCGTLVWDFSWLCWWWTPFGSCGSWEQSSLSWNPAKWWITEATMKIKTRKACLSNYRCPLCASEWSCCCSWVSPSVCASFVPGFSFCVISQLSMSGHADIWYYNASVRPFSVL